MNSSAIVHELVSHPFATAFIIAVAILRRLLSHLAGPVSVKTHPVEVPAFELHIGQQQLTAAPPQRPQHNCDRALKHGRGCASRR